MKNLFLISSTLAAFNSFSNAYADRIHCNPVEVGLVRSITIDSVSQKINTMRIEYMDSSVAAGAAEYSDDVDAVFFISRTLKAQLEYGWVEMQKSGHAHGLFYRDTSTSSKRNVIKVICRINSRFQ